MSAFQLSLSAFDFLKSLRKHNDRDWFNEHKDIYLREHEQIVRFADALLLEMNKHDVIETESGKKSLHRIYRDIRFSKDKTPYNIHWGGSFSRATKKRRGSYYFHLTPGTSFVAGGFWGPVPEDLKRIREEFSYNEKTIRKILQAKQFVSMFGTMQGEQLKTTPKGFEPDDPAIDLLRYKQFLLIKKFSDKEVLAPGFVKVASDTFKAMRPFLDFMTEALTTNVNGEEVV
ncbi:MAG: DUF2461 domain-containing protein [Bacteroidia bacterium]|nr:DUF2461 domain-containing protein [Bacteroidia bacterium]